MSELGDPTSYLELPEGVPVLTSDGEQIGTVGSANGRYLCHLHFEIRWTESSMWNQAGAGYADEKHGWIDPSEFIEKHRAPSSFLRFW